MVIRTSGCCAVTQELYVTMGWVHTTPNMRRLEDELCDTKTIHWLKRSSNKNSLCVFGCVNCLFAHSRIVYFPERKPTWMIVCMCLLLFQKRIHGTVIVCEHVCLSACACVYLSLYTYYSPLHIHLGFRISPMSDMGTLCVIGRGGGWWVVTSLFGVVEAVVVLVVGWGRGLWGATGEDRPTQQGEDSAHPASVKGEAERHQAMLLVGPDGKPHCRHHTTQCCEKTERNTVKLGI